MKSYPTLTLKAPVTKLNIQLYEIWLGSAQIPTAVHSLQRKYKQNNMDPHTEKIKRICIRRAFLLIVTQCWIL